MISMTAVMALTCRLAFILVLAPLLMQRLNAATNPMTHANRLIYAGALTGVLSAVFLLVSAIFVPEVAVAYLSQYYWVATFVLSYSIAPLCSRYFPRH